MNTKKLPTYFISHGGGPWPYMKKDMPGVYDQLEAALKDMPRQLGTTPKAVLVISGHWEERDFAVMASPTPPMLYDYSGFPEYTYKVKYSAPGSPELAARVAALIQNAGHTVHLDAKRGFDHGTFSPLVVIYPEADVPIVQLSMRRDYDVSVHLEIGRTLAPLREEGVLILASGLSYHNLRQFGPGAKVASKEFDDWLSETLVQAKPEERVRRLLAWDKAPSARLAHPREDHLIPLMVAVGAAQEEPAEVVYHESHFFGGISVSSFKFG